MPIISKFCSFCVARPEVAAVQGFTETRIFCYAAMRDGRRLQAANNSFLAGHRTLQGLCVLKFLSAPRSIRLFSSRQIKSDRHSDEKTAGIVNEDESHDAHRLSC
jgi:hypothetical protein